MLIDTHCHIQFNAYKDDYDAVIKKCLDKGMVLNLVGTQKDTSRWAVEMAEKYENVYATIGTHPIHLHPTHVDEEETHFMTREEGFDEPYYEELARSEKVIGVGECGLDLFHVPKDKSVEEVLEKQKDVFLAHYDFARKHELTLVVHCREAHEQMIHLLKSEISNQKSANPITNYRLQITDIKSKINGVIHCFTSNWDHAQEYLGMGFYLGFTGVITFPPKKTNPNSQLWLNEVVEKIPLDRIVVETDSPYLAPQKYRGERAEPWMVEEVVKRFAEVRGLSFDEMERRVEENTRALFAVIPDHDRESTITNPIVNH